MVFDKPSGTNRVNADAEAFANLSCLFEGSVYLLHFASLSEGTLFFMIFYTRCKRACMSLLHI